MKVSEIYQAIKDENAREALNHPERNDLGDDYANRELVIAAQMYIVGGYMKEQSATPGHIAEAAAESYPNKWGGKKRGAELLEKLTPLQCYVRACVLLIRQMRRL